MSKKNMVSIIIPTFSRPTNLVRAIDSALNQTYKNIEIIVVDDNGVGTPCQIETEKLLTKYISRNMIKYLRHDVNRNGSAARNTGFNASNGQYINFLDDDDEFLPEKIEKQVAYLETLSSEYGACYCNTEFISGERTRHFINSKEGNLIEDILLKKVVFNTSTVLFRRQTIDAINGFDDTFRRHQDFELFVRYFRIFKIGLVSDVLCIKHQTENVISKNPQKIIEYKQKFIDTFEADFLKMSKANEIMAFLYAETTHQLFFYKLRKEAYEYLLKSCKYKNPSFKEMLHYLKWWLLSYKK